MGGNRFMTDGAEENGPPQVLTLEAEALGLKIVDRNDKKVLVVIDVGSIIFRLCLASSFPVGSTSFFIQLVMRLFPGTIMPILCAIPGPVEIVPCFDALPNDLKEKYKALRMKEDEFAWRKSGLRRAYAINCVLARLINIISPVFFNLHEEHRRDDPTLPDLRGSTVKALVGPLEADDTAAVQYHVNADRDDIFFTLGVYVDNDNLASGAENLSTVFKLQQSNMKSLFIHDPVVNSNGKLEGTFVVPLKICERKGLHPQLVPVNAAVKYNDKSPGFDGIGNKKIWTEVTVKTNSFLSENPDLVVTLEEGLTPDWIRDLFIVLLDAGALKPLATRELTDERVEDVIKGAMESVCGLRSFFKDGKNREMLQRSQLGETVLEKIGVGDSAIFIEKDLHAFCYQALGISNLDFLFSSELAHTLAKDVLDAGIEISPRQQERDAWVVATCNVSKLSTTLPVYTYVARYTRLAQVLNKIGRGLVRRLRGLYQDPETGSLRPVMFFISSVCGGGYTIAVKSVLIEEDLDLAESEDALLVETSTGVAVVASNAPAAVVEYQRVVLEEQKEKEDEENGDLDLAGLNADLPEIAQIVDEDAPVETSFSVGTAAAAAVEQRLEDGKGGSGLAEEGALDDVALTDLNAAEGTEIETFPATPGDATGATAAVELAIMERDLATKVKRALVLQDIGGKAMLVLCKDDSSFKQCDADLAAVIADAYVPFEFQRGTAVCSPFATARSKIAVLPTKTLYFGEYWPLSKAFRKLKKSRLDLFYSSSRIEEANIIDLSVLVVANNNPATPKRITIKISVPEGRARNNLIFMHHAASTAGFPPDAVAVELGVNKDGSLAARFLDKKEAASPPWKFIVPEFCAVTVADCVAALIKSNSDAKKFDPIRTNLHVGYFRAPQENRTKAVLNYNRDSPFRQAVLNVHIARPFPKKPVPFAVLLLPSKVVVRAYITYQDGNNYIKADTDVLDECAMEYGGEKKEVYVNVDANPCDEMEEDGTDSEVRDRIDIAKEAVLNSLKLGELMERSPSLTMSTPPGWVPLAKKLKTSAEVPTEVKPFSRRFPILPLHFTTPCVYTQTRTDGDLDAALDEAYAAADAASTSEWTVADNEYLKGLIVDHHSQGEILDCKKLVESFEMVGRKKGDEEVRLKAIALKGYRLRYGSKGRLEII